MTSLYFCDLTLVLKYRSATNPFPDLPNFPFDSEEVVSILFRPSKGKLGRSGKGLVTALSFKTKVRSQKYKKVNYAIGNVIKKDLSEIIKEFEKIATLPYEKKRTKHEPTDSYFHLARQLAKCIMRSDNLNWNDHGNYTEMNAPFLNANVMDEDE